MRKPRPSKADDAIQVEIMDKLRLDQMVEEKSVACGEL